MSVYSETLDLIRRERLLEDGETVVVGLSGGPDSVCLLDVLALMTERGELDVALHAAHLNHCLRGAESDADEGFVRELAERRGVPLTVERRDVAASREEAGGSLEEAARRERYAFLTDAAGDVGAGAIAVGHQADDQVETVLHRLLRGAGLRGLGGMRLSRPVAEGSAVRLVRPLLRTRRREVLAHLDERGLRYREDASNVDRGFVRNRIRHDLLPLLESDYNPAVSEAVLRLSRAAAEAQDFLAVSAASADCVSGAGIRLDGFRELHDALKPLVIDRALAALGPAPQLDAVHYDSLIRAAEAGDPGGQVDLPGDVRAVRQRDRLTFSTGPGGAPAPEIETPLPVPGRADLPELGRTVEAELVDRSALDLDAFLSEKTRYHEVVDYDRLSGRLVVRSRRAGDRFRPLGATGTKTVGDFLTDAKVSPEERARVLVVAAGDQPVWVVGHRIDDRVKLRDDTARALLLTVREIGREWNGIKED